MVASNFSLEDIIINILALLVIAIFFGAMYAFIRSIFLFIFSQGDPENRKKAWNRVRFMIIGVLMTVGLLFIFPLGMKVVGIETYDRYSAKHVFEKVTKIFSQLFALREGFTSNTSVPGVWIEPGIQTQPPSADERSLDPRDYEL